MAFSLMVFLGVLATSYAGHMTYKDCNTSPNKVVHFTNAHLIADPVHIPGPEGGTIDVQVLREISGSHFKLSVNIQRHTTIFWLSVPCINGIGSCDYELCDLLSGVRFNNTHHCPLQIVESSPDFPCACPFAPGTYHLQSTAFEIPKLSGLWSWLAAGDYRVHAKLTDENTGEQVGCYDITITTEADCSGFSCIFG